ncbi:MAG: restriction endonuclease subunit S [Deltaproteobacteria bacterium]|nr:restriction endonuclease subunit S [Deltaproteobacteria bacterium]
MAYPAYAEYTSTRWDEVGSIPSEWEARRLKFAVLLRNEKIEAESANLEYMGLENIQSWTGKRIEDESSFSEGIANRFEPNDVLFGKLRPYLAKVYLAEKEGMATTEALVLQSERDLVPAFLKYLMLSDKFIDDVSGTTYGAKMPRANWDSIGSLPILLPDLTEQQQIADFLDWKTGQIDGLISKKQQLIEKLKEKRIALITQAVTKGLNPNAPMRDSGIPWLGEVPEHWEVRRLKFTALEPLKYGANESAECEDTDFPRYIRITDVKEDGSLHSDTFRSLLPEVAEPYLLTDGDILLARSGATVGKSFQYSPDWGKAAYAGYLIRFRVDSSVLLPIFAYYFTKSQIYWANINSTLIQSTIQNFNAEKYGSINIPVPPLGEQEHIVKAISRKCIKIDSLTLAAQQVVDRLTEYRTALITATTNGKIDVRNVKIGGAA